MKTNKKYIKYYFKSGWDNDLMVALLSGLTFDSFEELDNAIVAYIHEDLWNDEFKQQLQELCVKYKIDFEQESIKDRNWNLEWEQNFKPVEINDFCLVRANFHSDKDDSKYKYVLKINPEMTFGTGHHETTVMMIELMSNISCQGSKVFDYGSGTGILAILAEKMGASELLAVDNDELAVQNIKDNSALNECNKIESKYGETAEVGRFTYDLVLANINRNILEQEVVNLSLSLKKGGFLILSGILKTDEERIISLYENNSMKLINKMEMGKWVGIKFVAY